MLVEIAWRFNSYCVNKAQLPLLTMSMLGLFAGAFAFGAP